MDALRLSTRRLTRQTGSHIFDAFPCLVCLIRKRIRRRIRVELGTDRFDIWTICQEGGQDAVATIERIITEKHAVGYRLRV